MLLSKVHSRQTGVLKVFHVPVCRVQNLGVLPLTSDHVAHGEGSAAKFS